MMMTNFVFHEECIHPCYRLSKTLVKAIAHGDGTAFACSMFELSIRNSDLSDKDKRLLIVEGLTGPSDCIYEFLHKNFFSEIQTLDRWIAGHSRDLNRLKLFHKINHTSYELKLVETIDSVIIAGNSELLKQLLVVHPSACVKKEQWDCFFKSAYDRSTAGIMNVLTKFHQVTERCVILLLIGKEDDRFWLVSDVERAIFILLFELQLQ